MAGEHWYTPRGRLGETRYISVARLHMGDHLWQKLWPFRNGRQVMQMSERRTGHYPSDGTLRQNPQSAGCCRIIRHNAGFGRWLGPPNRHSGAFWLVASRVIQARVYVGDVRPASERSMRFQLVLSILVLARVTPAQTPDTTHSARGATVSGVVRDSIAHGPLVGAMVQLVAADTKNRFGRTAVSDSMGAFKLGDVPAILLSECWADLHQIAQAGSHDPDWKKKGLY